MHKFFLKCVFSNQFLQKSIVIVPYHSTSSLCILNKHILTLVFCSNKKESNYRRRGSLHYDKSLSILPFTFLTIIAFFNFYPVLDVVAWNFKIQDNVRKKSEIVQDSARTKEGQGKVKQSQENLRIPTGETID